MKVIVTINSKIELGLQVWQVKVNGTLSSVHMSEQGARSAVLRLKLKLNLAA